MSLDEEVKWEYITQLDDELLLGGVALSEWTTFLARDSETAYCSGAYLSSILSAQAAIESHLRYDYFYSAETKGWSFFELIEKSDLDDDLKNELHILRKFRNKWIHVNDPSNDEDLLERPAYYENELADFSTMTIKTMLKILYSNPYI
jgi:hypothetical protein